jgi:hypothetical protein
MKTKTSTLKYVLAVASSAGLLATTPAIAEGPMATDDAGTLVPGGMKVEAVVSRDDKTRGSEIGFGYSPFEKVEIGLIFARESDRSDDPSTNINGTGFGIKWVPIQNDTGWSLGVSLGYGRAKVDVRAADNKFTEKEYALAGLATYRFVSGQVLHMNVGGARVKAEGESDTVGTWGIGYEFPLMERLQLTVEAFGAEHARPDKAIGLRYEVFDGFKVSGAVGRGNDRSFGQLGVAWEF